MKLAKHFRAVTMEERQELCSKTVLLDGEAAVVSGWKNDFARVTQLRTGLSAEWSWEAVRRIVGKGGEFHAS